MKKEYILFIDSGVGGLSTLAETIKILPTNYLYFADNLHSPYGAHTDAEIFEYLKKIIEGLKQKFEFRLVVLACNTATTSSIKNLRKHFTDLVFVGTEPAVRLASNGSAKSVLCLATPTTAKQRRFGELKDMLAIPSGTLAIESLAPNIESFLIGDSMASRLALLRDISKVICSARKFDAVVLGCTHYVLISDILKNYVTLPVFDGNFGVAKQVARLYKNSEPSEATVIFRFSDPKPGYNQKYRKIFEQILAKP